MFWKYWGSECVLAERERGDFWHQECMNARLEITQLRAKRDYEKPFLAKCAELRELHEKLSQILSDANVG